MSGFEDNPFGDPMVDNPFADPSIQQVTRNTTATTQNLEDYNPFENENAGGRTQQPQMQPTPAVHQPGAFNQPAIVQPSTQTIPTAAQAYNNNQAPQISTAELQRQKEELDRKAQELERREQELRSNSSSIRRNNWPPVPEKCCFQPCFYHDINVDIAPDFQKVVRQLYYLWMFYALVMCVNILGGFILMFHAADFTTFSLGILYAFLFTPASFLCWYRPIYKAFRSDSSFNFMVFFFIFFFQVVVTVIQTIGIPGSGTCGFILALSQFDSSAGGIVVGILLLIIALMFGSLAAANVMMLTKVHSIYRSTDASMQKAQEEFASEFMRNQHVQRAAANAATAAVNTQFQNNRY